MSAQPIEPFAPFEASVHYLPATDLPPGPATADCEGINARITAALAEVWREIRRRHPDVPEAVVTTTAGPARTAVFSPMRWCPINLTTGSRAVPEVAVAQEDLCRGAVEVLRALLHEAAAGLCWARKTPYVSDTGYHNTAFRDAAHDMGLEAEFHRKRGWSKTSIPETTAAAWAGYLGPLEKTLTHYRQPEVLEPVKPKPKGNSKVSVDCECQQERARRLWGAPGTLALGGVICQVCGGFFKAEAEREEETTPEPVPPVPGDISAD